MEQHSPGSTLLLLQGARLTAWELRREGIEMTVICDNMAGHLMARGEVDVVVAGGIAPAYYEVSLRDPVRVLSLSDEEVELVRERQIGRAHV